MDEFHYSFDISNIEYPNHATVALSELSNIDWFNSKVNPYMKHNACILKEPLKKTLFYPVPRCFEQ